MIVIIVIILHIIMNHDSISDFTSFPFFIALAVAIVAIVALEPDTLGFGFVHIKFYPKSNASIFFVAFCFLR